MIELILREILFQILHTSVELEKRLDIAEIDDILIDILGRLGGIYDPIFSFPPSGIYIHKLKDKNGNIDTKGKNPFNYVYTPTGIPLSTFVPNYDWFDDRGKENIGDWIEEVARKVGR